ncbi:uncharacterized protein UDID_05046 [Ustilago sp. UG-2017a]|nr:uncharacterized protein UDID_05046 [Ustilago sp. UG-2017a]
MSTTPSPSKRARLPTASTVPSATASPFPTGPYARPPPGPRSVGPSGTSNLAPAIGLGMSPVDALSPSHPEQYALSGFTPYNTTSPAYAGNSHGAMTAASPISAALAHGSRVLSNIQASPMYGTPMMMNQPYPPRFAMQPQQAQQQQNGAGSKVQTAPQPGSPEYLKFALQHLQTILLARLEAEAEIYFDAVDSSLSVEADTRVVAQKAKAFEEALDTVLSWVEKNGLASIPLLPLPDPGTGSKSGGLKDNVAAAAVDAPRAKEEPPKDAAEKEDPDATTNKDAATGPSLEEQISELQQKAKELFDRRQRLKESASIVTGILES